MHVRSRNQDNERAKIDLDREAVTKLKMVYGEYTTRRIICHYRNGLKAYSIQIQLKKEGITVSRRGVAKLLDRFKERGTTHRKKGSGSKKLLIEEQMRADDETTAIQLKNTYLSIPW